MRRQARREYTAAPAARLATRSAIFSGTPAGVSVIRSSDGQVTRQLDLFVAWLNDVGFGQEATDAVVDAVSGAEGIGRVSSNLSASLPYIAVTVDRESTG